MTKVIGFGALNVDQTYEVSSSFVEDTGAQHGSVIEGKSFGSLEYFKQRLSEEKFLYRSGGGSAANAVLALSQMGYDTGYVGKLGYDSDGDFILSNLGEIDISHVFRGNERTGVSFLLQTKENKDRITITFPGTNDTIRPEDVDIDYINSAGVLHLTSFSGDRSFQTQIDTLRRINNSVLVSFDGGEKYARRGLDALKPILERSYIIFPSVEEVRILTGEDYTEGAKILLTKGPEIVCVTRSSNGSYVATQDEEFNTTQYFIRQKDIRDTIGAGDVFAASFLAGLLKNKSLRACAEFANKMAAKSLTGAARERYPTKQDIEEFLKK